MKPIKNLILFIISAVLLAGCVGKMTDEEILQRAKEIEANKATATATPLITEFPAPTTEATAESETPESIQSPESNDNTIALDSSYYAEVYSIIRTSFYDNLFIKYAEPLVDNITSFEYYSNMDGEEILRANLDISVTEAMYLIGDSDLDVEVSENEYEEMTLEYPDTEGKVVFRHSSIFFENFDLSCINTKDMADIFPDDLSPELTPEQGENKINIIMQEDGAINIVFENIYSGADQHNLKQSFTEMVIEKYAKHHNKHDGLDIYESYLPKGAELWIEIGNYTTSTSITLRNDSTAMITIDENNIDNFIVTETSKKLFDILKNYLYEVQISLADAQEMMFLDENNEFYTADKGESLLYMFYFDRNTDMNKLTEEICSAFPDYRTKAAANQFWSYEESQLFGLFKIFDYKYVCSAMVLNDYDLPENCILFECELEPDAKAFLSAPDELANIQSKEIDIKITVNSDGSMSAYYYNEIFVLDMSFKDVIAIMENHFGVVMGEFEKVTEGKYVSLLGTENECLIEMDNRGEYIYVYFCLNKQLE